MPQSKTKAAQRQNLAQNLSSLSKRTFDHITSSPRKLISAFSPRKKTRHRVHKEEKLSTRSRSSDALNPTPLPSNAHGVCDDPFSVIAFQIPAPDPPSEAPMTFESELSFSECESSQDASSDASDASTSPQPGFSRFRLPGANTSPPAEAPTYAQIQFSYRPPSIEDVDNEDDRISTPTFHLPHNSRHILCPTDPHEDTFSPHRHLGDDNDDHLSSRDTQSSVPDSDRENSDGDEDEIDDDPRGFESLPSSEFSDPPSSFVEDAYPRPQAPKTAVREHFSVPDADGVHRRRPLIADAREALLDAHAQLRGRPRGDLRTREMYGKAGVGYHDCKLDPLRRARVHGIRAVLALFTDEGSLTFGQWGESTKMAAIAMHRGPHCARVLAELSRQYIIDRSVAELNPYGKWTNNMLVHEDVKADVVTYLQSLGRYITAEKLQMFLCSPEFKQRHGIEKDVGLKTACRYLDELGYRFTSPKVGQYTDGHERPDVVEYRNKVYLPRYFELQERVKGYDNDGFPLPPSPPPPPPVDENGRQIPIRIPTTIPVSTPAPATTVPVAPPRRVIIWYHDESIFYAHDRRHKAWYHKDASAKPYMKGEGYSYMVADFFSADFGWLRNPWTGKSARACIKPGANRDGYFTNVEVRQQARTAVEIVNELWPQFDHVFVYDNATTHRKRPDGALSALNMPKAPSGSTARYPEANLMGERTVLGADGKPLYGANGKVLKEKVRMFGAKLPDGSDQDLYFPDNHERAGKFKGMEIVLQERGMHEEAKLPAECKNFKCADTSETAACCCRRVLFNQPDFVNVKSLLEEECEAGGVEVLFTPRFHCELNPIEMVWGYAKRLYRLNPESGRQDVLENNTLAALEGVPLLCMRRFVNRSHKFADAYYHKRLTGPEAAWAARKYHGHRTLPASVLAELEAAQISPNAEAANSEPTLGITLAPVCIRQRCVFINNAGPTIDEAGAKHPQRMSPIADASSVHITTTDPQLTSITESGREMEENFSRLLILESLRRQKIIRAFTSAS
ncbi:hypothetical protein MKEN_00277100 [Mycena kentingensis (nom. inval.)]|nr:hypothetical protein MKEN_00277100 [Mycena kentingensis (nom. inval.)]